ncbi:MAG TPA: sulfotransferase [Woeseiaceae bacterium]|nr:sulfotransferase [Woeseiaceae bacterium]
MEEQAASASRERRPVYLYISSRGHSGSTFLSMLLARHPQVAAVGELAHLPLQVARDEKASWIGRCSCGERPFDCTFWGPVLREIGQEQGVDLEARPFGWRISDVGLEEEHRAAAPLRVPLVWARNRFWRLIRYGQYMLPAPLALPFMPYQPQRKWGRNRAILVEKIARAFKVDAVVDASKDPLDMIDVYRHAPLPVKIIYLTRDCRGNVWSMLKRLLPGETRESRLVSAANEWRSVNGRIWRLIRDVPQDAWLHVKYEDICRQPSVELNRIFEFAGLEPIDVTAAISESAVDRHAHTIGGNRVRFTSDAIRIREDQAWRENLTPDELAVIDRISGPLARELGYEL